jgi:hypothetical protein
MPLDPVLVEVVVVVATSLVVDVVCLAVVHFLVVMHLPHPHNFTMDAVVLACLLFLVPALPMLLPPLVILVSPQLIDPLVRYVVRQVILPWIVTTA